MTQLPQSFVLTDMGFALFGLSDLIFDPAKLDGKQGMGNIGVVYDDPAIDASHPARRRPARAARTASGRTTPPTAASET